MSRIKQSLPWILLGTLVVALFGILLFPIVQAVGYGLLVQSPAIWWWGIVGTAGAYGLYRAGLLDDGYASSEAKIISAAVAVFVLTFMVGPFMSGVYAQQHILETQDFEQRAELQDTSTEHVRVLPRNVANSYADSANQLPKYKTGDSDIAYNNGTYTWSYPVVPDRAYVTWQGNQWGAFYVDMEQTDRSVERSQTTMENGLGQVFIDSYAYQSSLKRVDVAHQQETTFVFEDEGETHIARSYVTHDWHFRLLPIPQPYAVPEYGGTIVADKDGNFEDYSPEEVASSEMFEGQNTYPYGLARFRMKSMQLQHGVLNKLFVGDSVPMIADTGEAGGNSQPFTVPVDTEDGTPKLDYYIAATPSGSGSGIYQIYTIDGQTGAIEYVEFDDTQAGPSKAAGYTRSADREPDWVASNEEGSTMVTEPIPLIIGGDLYWHMRVTPTDGARVSYTTFVNAYTGSIYRATETAEIVSFIERGGADGGVERGGTDNGTSGDGVVTVTIVEDGRAVDSFTITKNQSVVINATSE